MASRQRPMRRHALRKMMELRERIVGYSYSFSTSGSPGDCARRAAVMVYSNLEGVLCYGNCST